MADAAAQLLRPEVRKHESGLRTQALTGPAVETYLRHVVDLPPCCPVSSNPRAGSTLSVSYIPAGWCLEVYSLAQVVGRFRGGWRGTERYPPERNMEGMIRTLAQMAADALELRVRVRADLVLDVGKMVIRASAEPRP